MRGSKLRLRRSRSRGSSVLAVVGGCLGVYAVFAVAFHWLVEPTVKIQAVAPYEPSLARAVQSSATSFVTPARPDLPSRVTSKPPASARVAAPAPKSTEPARSEPPSRTRPPPRGRRRRKPQNSHRWSHRNRHRQARRRRSPRKPRRKRRRWRAKRLEMTDLMTDLETCGIR